MLFLLFKIGPDRYALEAARVVEVIPLLGLKQNNSAPRGTAGIFNYHGRFVSAVDLCERLLRRPALECLSTRIIIVKHLAGSEKQLLGLIAEEVTGVFRAERGQFSLPANPPAQMPPWPVLFDSQGAIHLLDESRLLSQNLLDQLAHGSD